MFSDTTIKPERTTTGDHSSAVHFSRLYLVRSRLCYSVASVCGVCIVVKRCVLEQMLLLTAYRKSYDKSIGSKMNYLDLCLKVV